MDSDFNLPVPDGGWGSLQEKIGAHVLHVQRQVLDEQRKNNGLMMELLQELRSSKVADTRPLKGNAQVRK